MDPAPVGHVAALHRYPVKSLTGETLARADVDCRGLAGDRLWAVRDPDGKLGSGKSSRRFRRMDGLLALRATYDGQVPVVEWPDGRRLRGDDPAVDDALSAHVGRPVSLGREADVPHFDDGPVHLVTTATVGASRPRTAHRSTSGTSGRTWCSRPLTTLMTLTSAPGWAVRCASGTSSSRCAPPCRAASWSTRPSATCRPTGRCCAP